MSKPKPTPGQRRKLYDAFASEFGFCWACEWFPGLNTMGTPYPYRKPFALPKLDIAHIVGGPGRRHDRRALTRLCDGCHHGGAHGERIRVNGTLMPRLTLANLLWLKQSYDPDNYDPAYIQSLRTARAEVLTPEIPCEWYQKWWNK